MRGAADGPPRFFLRQALEDGGFRPQEDVVGPAGSEPEEGTTRPPFTTRVNLLGNRLGTRLAARWVDAGGRVIELRVSPLAQAAATGL
jgi:hypothetical protein